MTPIPQPKEAAVATHTTMCSGCGEKVVVDTDAGTATVHVASNAKRGAGHVPAHDVESGVWLSESVLLCWDCPACNYGDSLDLSEVPTGMRKYVVTMRHDNGSVRIATMATSADAAADAVCQAELAPRRAVVSVRPSSP